MVGCWGQLYKLAHQGNKIIYKGQELILRPSTEKFSQSVVVFSKSLLNDEDAFVLIRRFLSALAWFKGHPVEETTSVRGSVPIQIGRGSFSCGGSTGFELDHIPETDSPKALLALAFYREALNVNSTPYKFLGFFKIINILYGNGKSQIQWIKDTLPKLDDLSARERVAQLETSQGGKVADYFQKEQGGIGCGGRVDGGFFSTGRCEWCG